MTTSYARDRTGLVFVDPYNEEFGRRNAVPGEVLVRIRAERVIAQADVAGY